MIVGVPKERKIQEYGVALTDGLPSAAKMTRGLKLKVREILRESIDDGDSLLARDLSASKTHSAGIF